MSKSSGRLTRRVFNPELKAKVALAAFHEDKTLAELCQQFALDPLVFTLHAHITPSSYSWIGTSSGINGLNLNYGVKQNESYVDLYIDRGTDSQEENQSIFDQLKIHEQIIAQVIGKEVLWERLDNRRASRIRIKIQGGYRSPDADWAEIQNNMVDAMNKLNQALSPLLPNLQLAQ